MENPKRIFHVFSSYQYENVNLCSFPTKCCQRLQYHNLNHWVAEEIFHAYPGSAEEISHAYPWSQGTDVLPCLFKSSSEQL